MPNESTSPTDSSRFEPLTFEASTVPGAASCGGCGTVLRGSYHLAGETMVCAKCRYAAEAKLNGATGAAGLLRAVMFGGSAAIVGAVAYYAFVKLTDHEWALITAFVGIGVGMAVRIGSRGHGGRKFQLVAVILTWLAMGGSHLPFLVDGARDAKTPPVEAPATNVPNAGSLRSYADSTAALQATSAGDDGAPAVPAATTDSTPAPATSLGEPVYIERSLGSRLAIVAAAVLAGLFATPVIVAVANPIAGLCTAYALYRAWKTNAGGPILETSGPFRLRDGTAGASAG